MPAFLAVTNIQTTNDRAIGTNAERVVTARLRDARFFWDADRQVGLEGRLAASRDRARSTSSSGRIAQKTERIERLARWIAARSSGGRSRPRRPRAAARLAKADLATDMVREFTELQGTMGGIYAREARRARGGLEGDLPPVPADGRRSRRAADGRRARCRRD